MNQACSVQLCLQTRTISALEVPASSSYQAVLELLLSSSNHSSLHFKDFATQVYWWDAYKAACRSAKVQRGRFVAPEVAEWLAGYFTFDSVSFKKSHKP